MKLAAVAALAARAAPKVTPEVAAAAVPGWTFWQAFLLGACLGLAIGLLLAFTLRSCCQWRMAYTPRVGEGAGPAPTAAGSKGTKDDLESASAAQAPLAVLRRALAPAGGDP